MSNKQIPGLSVTDGVDFIKKIWGSLPIPSVMSPTTDLDELDKRISDLKAVDQWLNVNLNMLRATIQGLEVQRGTIATLKSFSDNFGRGDPDLSKAQSAQQSHQQDILKGASASVASDDASKQMLDNANAWWSMLQNQFNQVATTAMMGASPQPLESKAEDKKATATRKPNGKTTGTRKKPSPGQA